MSHFEDFNAENKLRIPLSAYAANIIENDCSVFSLKKTTLINTIILNFYQTAPCSISLQTANYKNELLNTLGKTRLPNMDFVINTLVQKKAQDLSMKYAKRLPSDVNWQITLNKRVKALLTEDPNSQEENYYGTSPGHYVRAIIEEYALLPFYSREYYVYKKTIDTINVALQNRNTLNITTTKGHHLTLKPYKIEKDPLSAYHYLIGESLSPLPFATASDSTNYLSNIISIRVSRISYIESLLFQYKPFTAKETEEIEHAMLQKGVAFLSSEKEKISIWLSDTGIQRFNNQINLRPIGLVDEHNPHIYYFDCTDTQIFYYFFSFGKDAKVLSPSSLKEQFKNMYHLALNNYQDH